MIAAALVRFAPDHEDGAKTLVDGLKGEGELLGVAQQEITRVIRSGPSALVERLIELSYDDEYRSRSLDLLSKIDPKAL